MLPWKGKGKMVPWFEEICTLGDSLNFCKIIGVSMELVQEPIARDLFRFSTGFDVDARIKDSINTSQEPVKKDNYDMPTFIRKNETKEIKSQPLSFLDKELPKQADEENNDIEDIDIPAFLRKQID
mgnify:CR=1 FL=1